MTTYPPVASDSSVLLGTVEVGIVVLNYHHPKETIACIQSLLAAEGPGTRILWIENDAAATAQRLATEMSQAPFPWLDLREGDPLPPPGTIGVVRNMDNLGYAAGNNVGLRILHRAGVPWAWILNNDILLTQGSSRDLVAQAQAHPHVGLWGVRIHSDFCPCYFGGLLRWKDFSIRFATEPGDLDTPGCFISGCALFFRTDLGAEVGWIPEDYFLYYEDPAFSIEIQRKGHSLGFNQAVAIDHHQSLSTGHRSWLMEYYSRRNRWRFVQRYFPDQLKGQERLFFRYQIQKLLFRLRFDRINLEWKAYRDFKAGQVGRSKRTAGKLWR